MAKKTKPTIGQKLWRSLIEADNLETQGSQIPVQQGATKADVNRATKAWYDGRAKSLKVRFSAGLRQGREKLGITQQQIAEFAGFSTNAIAMIERGERIPSIDTAARICWALDMISGVEIPTLTS
jgi:DNA-binding XRE family transcriptional regulator